MGKEGLSKAQKRRNYLAGQKKPRLNQTYIEEIHYLFDNLKKEIDQLEKQNVKPMDYPVMVSGSVVTIQVGKSVSDGDAEINQAYNSLRIDLLIHLDTIKQLLKEKG